MQVLVPSTVYIYFSSDLLIANLQTFYCFEGKQSFTFVLDGLLGNTTTDCGKVRLGKTAEGLRKQVKVEREQEMCSRWLEIDNKFVTKNGKLSVE